jgi:hypothetical protein
VNRKQVVKLKLDSMKKVSIKESDCLTPTGIVSEQIISHRKLSNIKTPAQSYPRRSLLVSSTFISQNEPSAKPNENSKSPKKAPVA